MKQEHLTHLLKLSSLLGEGADVLVIGSQAILAVAKETELPAVTVTSTEADIAFLDGDEDKADRVDVMLGEDSKFHRDFGYYAQGVGVTTATMPDGWRDRLIRFPVDLPEGQAWCPDPHDLVAAKLVALREKDIAYTAALVQAGLVDLNLLTDRLQALPATVHPDVVKTALGLVDGWRSGHEESP